MGLSWRKGKDRVLGRVGGCLAPAGKGVAAWRNKYSCWGIGGGADPLCLPPAVEAGRGSPLWPIFLLIATSGSERLGRGDSRCVYGEIV